MRTGPARRSMVLLILGVSAFLGITLILSFRNSGPSDAVDYGNVAIHPVDASADTLYGNVIAPKLGNETLKAELGRAAWKLFHTTMATFPDRPTADESTALSSYIHLFARLYPCGECAGHFRQLLAKWPPQVDSRSSAAAWACHVHNEVNKSLRKKLFDCSKIGDFYDCGCARDNEEEHSDGELSHTHKTPKTVGGVEDDHSKPLKLEKEGLTKGG